MFHIISYYYQNRTEDFYIKKKKKKAVSFNNNNRDFHLRLNQNSDWQKILYFVINLSQAHGLDFRGDKTISKFIFLCLNCQNK